VAVPILFPIRSQSLSKAVYHDGDYGPCFGDDIWMRNNFNENRKSETEFPGVYSNDSWTWEKRTKSDLLGGNGETGDREARLFNVIDIEVFSIAKSK